MNIVRLQEETQRLPHLTHIVRVEELSSHLPPPGLPSVWVSTALDAKVLGCSTKSFGTQHSTREKGRYHSRR
jgi:hypothetical protein